MHVATDSRLAELVDHKATVERIAGGFRFTEGPVWDSRQGCLLFSNVRAHVIHRWSERNGVSIYREFSNGANGNTFDPQGRLLTCEPRKSFRRLDDGSVETHGEDPMAGARCVTRTEPDGTVQLIATHFNGGRFSSPNDVVCLANGDILFTDPDFGLRHADGSMTPRETPFNGVYRIDHRDGSLSVVTGNLETPNGLVVTDDGSRLLVADTRHHVVRSYPLDGADATGRGEVFCDLTYEGHTGHPDGMKLDVHGNLYIAGGTDDGVWVFDPQGRLLGLIAVPERPTNLAWGDADWQALYITTITSVYRVRLKIRGQALNPGPPA
jgi:sugar lactone lactonase YvrE